MTVREQHYKSGWSDRHIISVDRYIDKKGLDLKYCWQRVSLGPVPTMEEVDLARTEAFIQERNCHHVITTYLDADVVPENSRNAPLDGNAPMVEKDEWGFMRSPKKHVSLDGDKFYDWKPLTTKDVYNYRKKVKTFASTFNERQKKIKKHNKTR